MADNLTFTVNNPYPVRSGTAATASGGSFTADTYSFLAVAWYRVSETDNDFAGWSLTASDDWDGVVVTANQQVTLTITKPSKTIGGNTVYAHYDHIAVYIQTAATFDLTAAAGKCSTITLTDTNASTVTAVIKNENTSGNETFGSSYTTQSTAEGQVNMRGVPRENTLMTAAGSELPRSYAADLLFSELELSASAVFMSGSMTAWHLLLKAQKYGIYMKLTDNSSTSFITDYYGIIKGASYPGSTGKNIDRPSLMFKVDREDEA